MDPSVNVEAMTRDELRRLAKSSAGKWRKDGSVKTQPSLDVRKTQSRRRAKVAKAARKRNR